MQLANEKQTSLGMSVFYLMERILIPISVRVMRTTSGARWGTCHSAAKAEKGVARAPQWSKKARNKGGSPPQTFSGTTRRLLKALPSKDNPKVARSSPSSATMLNAHNGLTVMSIIFCFEQGLGC